MRAVVAALAAVVCAGIAPAGPLNLLQNPDLEMPFDEMGGSNIATGWELIEPDLDGAGAPVNSASFESFGNHTPGGDRGLWFRSFEGGLGGDKPFTVNAHLQQTLPGAPGVEYAISAWFRYEANYSGADPMAPTQTILAIDFLDGAAMVISSAELDIDGVQDNDSVWRQFSVDGVAPAGTAFVRARASMIDGVLSPANPQSAFVDDFILVPAPGALVLLASAILLTVSGRRAR